MNGEAEAQHCERTSPKTHKWFDSKTRTRLCQAKTLLILPHRGRGDLTMEPVGFCYVPLYLSPCMDTRQTKKRSCWKL